MCSGSQQAPLNQVVSTHISNEQRWSVFKPEPESGGERTEGSNKSRDRRESKKRSRRGDYDEEAGNEGKQRKSHEEEEEAAKGNERDKWSRCALQSV